MESIISPKEYEIEIQSYCVVVRSASFVNLTAMNSNKTV